MKRSLWMIVLLECLAGGGCASLQGDDYGVFDAGEGFNRASYEFSDRLDRNLLVPVARGYKNVTPQIMQDGLDNMFSNLRALPSSLNGFLQGKPAAGGEDFGRFVVNSVIGLGGLFDPARTLGLKHQEEDFGQTLAVWGWRKSRFIYVPFLGPTTVRDLPSVFIRSYMPRLLIGSDYPWGASGLDLLNTRAQLLTSTDVRDTSALDPYIFTRDAFLQRRKYLIYDGDVPLDDIFDDFDDFDDFEVD